MLANVGAFPEDDPDECQDLSASPAHAGIRDWLSEILIGELYSEDEQWIQDGKLVGLPDAVYKPGPNRGLGGQRGSHWPIPPSAGNLN